MSFIEPLALQTWIVSVFSGNPEIFFGIALVAIIGMAAYFKMTTLTMFFMIGLFVLMFQDFITPGITTLFIVIFALIVGFVINKISSRQ